MATNRHEYDKMVKKASNPSPVFKNSINAFLIGGFICTFAEALKLLFGSFNFNTDETKAAVTITLITITAILTGIGIFDKIAKVAGAGTIVPITGFANAVVSPAMEFKTDERDIIGLSRKAP